MQQKGDVSGAFMAILIKNAGIYAENGIQTYQGLASTAAGSGPMTNNEAEIDAFLLRARQSDLHNRGKK